MAFTAIFLQALRKLGYRLGEETNCDTNSPLFRKLMALHPNVVNYVARDGSGPDGYNPVWQDAMMKTGTQGKWVFNNVNDSVVKTYKVLCEKLGLSTESYVEDTEVMDLDTVDVT